MQPDMTVNFRVVGLNCHEQNPFDVDVIGEGFGIQMQKLLEGKPVQCVSANQELPALRPPTTLLIDVCVLFLPPSLRTNDRPCFT